MHTDKELLDKSVDLLRDKAEECVDLAKAQRNNADKQHEAAHKLEVLGTTLAHDAAAIRGEIDKKTEAPLPAVTTPSRPRAARIRFRSTTHR
jgi:hypothetical protein